MARGILTPKRLKQAGIEAETYVKLDAAPVGKQVDILLRNGLVYLDCTNGSVTAYYRYAQYIRTIFDTAGNPITLYAEQDGLIAVDHLGWVQRGAKTDPMWSLEKSKNGPKNADFLEVKSE